MSAYDIALEHCHAITITFQEKNGYWRQFKWKEIEMKLKKHIFSYPFPKIVEAGYIDANDGDFLIKFISEQII